MEIEPEIPEVFQNTSVDPALPRDDLETKKEEPPKVDEETQKPEDQQKAEEPVPKGVQRRIDRAVRQKYEAEARAKMLEERLANLERNQVQPQQRPAPADSEEPTIDKYNNFDEYVAAKASYIARKQIENTLAEREQRQSAERESAARQTTAAQWNERVSKATAEMPDFEDVVASSEVPMTDAMQQAIMESENGPKLAYYLANNPDEARQIASMNPLGAIRTLGRIEERLSSKTPPSKPIPPPVTTVGSKASVKKSPGAMTDAEYAKWRKQA